MTAGIKENPAFQGLFSGGSKILENPNQIGKLYSIIANAMEFAKYFTQTRSLDKSIRVFGAAGAVYDALQFFGTIHYAAANTFKVRAGLLFFNNDNSSLDFLTELAFGVASVSGAILWAEQHRLIDLGRYTVQSIGGATAGSAALLGAVSMGLIGGFTVMTANSLVILESGLHFKNGKSVKLTNDEKISYKCTIAWSVSQIALVVIPAVGFAPAAPWMLGATIASQGFGLASFLYKNTKGA
jgi:hypothetical protein